MEIILVRHGQTVNNSIQKAEKQETYYSEIRQSDSELTPMGRCQIE
jgi:broad specificity phosphatase PhoE